MGKRGKVIASDYSVALVGNPNVGKSTLFNALTGLKQHTGNWTGKTVEFAEGVFSANGHAIKLTDLPGTYSLSSFSPDETVTRDYLSNQALDCVVIVADAGALERSLTLALEVLAENHKAVLCLNLCDEAARNGVSVDRAMLTVQLGIPVVMTSAKRKQGLSELRLTVAAVCSGEIAFTNTGEVLSGELVSRRAALARKSREICNRCVKKEGLGAVTRASLRLDRILTSKKLGIPIMLSLFLLLFWITAVGANYPSQWLAELFGIVKSGLFALFELMHVPEYITGLMIDGVYNSLSWVVAVMLPPMAIFFPLFSIMEDSGYLPRIAFNLDSVFARCGAHGKQSLTMAMGIGCNACGVTGCRIIESHTERLIAILTNSFMPCNGRLPILIAVLSVFFAGEGFAGSLITASGLTVMFLACVLMTLAVSKLLSMTVCKGEKSGYAMELPPYRLPQLGKTLTRSLLDRTLKVLGRAAAVAAPAGAVIWLLANTKLGGASVLSLINGFLDPFGKAVGLDGVTVTAFILGFPANETVIPIILMSYLSSSSMCDYAGYSELGAVLSANGWTVKTAVCMLIMTAFHFPCSTTCLTVKKETGKLRWTLLSIVLPTAVGVLLCFIVNLIIP